MIRSRNRSAGFYFFVAFSAVVHLALASLMLLGPRKIAVAPPGETLPTLEFLLVQREGSGPSTPPPNAPSMVDPPAAKPVAAAPPSPSQTEPTPELTDETDGEPAPAPPQRPTPPPTPSAPDEAASSPALTPASTKPSPRINLGGTDSLSSLIATGEQIVPPAIDSKIHNREPVYPREAARLRQQGAVILLVRVAPDGSASEVVIPQSSGFPMLDAAAREAVSSWHFRPAIQDGQGVASEIPVRIQFTLN